jgi:hypothetical protein
MDKEILSTIQAMTLADIRNELEAHGLSTLGTKAEITERLLQFKRARGKRNPSVIAASFSQPQMSSTPNKHDSSSFEEEMRDLKSVVKDQMNRANEKEKELEDRISNHLDQLSKQMMMLFGSRIQEHQQLNELSEVRKN